jgi:hypothetical protein
MKTTRRFACTAALLLPGTAFALRPELPDMPTLAACEAPGLHETLRSDLVRRAGEATLPAAALQDLAQARCPRCGCDLFGAGAGTAAPGDIPDPRNLF